MRAIQLALIGHVMSAAVVYGLGVDLGRPDEALTRLFTPRAVPAGTYVVYRSTRALEAIVADITCPISASWIARICRPSASA
jgi:hypothetical protein